MKKILLSLFTIAVVGALISGGTMAYFSDTETKSGNTFTAGTINISLDPATGQIVTIDGGITDLKPCETGYITFTIHNASANPVVLWKHLGNIVCTGGTWTDAEITADPDNTKHNIAPWIEYDLEAGSAVIFSVDDGLTVTDIASMWMPLGTLGPGDDLVVKQSYHMKAETGNWAQGDVMTFDIDIYGEQRLGDGPSQLSKKLFLDNKTGDPDWYFVADNMWGVLTWDGTGTASFVANGLAASTGYALITYTDPWPGYPSKEIAHGNSDADGKISWSGLNLPSGYTGKVWLVLDADHDAATQKMTGWNPTSYLFEANKVVFP